MMQRWRTMDAAFQKALDDLPSLKAKVRRALEEAGPDGLITEEIEHIVGGKHQTLSATANALIAEGRARWKVNPDGSDVVRKNDGGHEQKVIEVCDVPPPGSPREPIGRGWVVMVAGGSLYGEDGRVFVFPTQAAAEVWGEAVCEVLLKPVVRTRRGGDADDGGPTATEPDPAPALPSWFGRED